MSEKKGDENKNKIQELSERIDASLYQFWEPYLLLLFFFFNKMVYRFLNFSTKMNTRPVLQSLQSKSKKKKVKVLFFVRLLIDRCVNSAISVLVDTPYLKGTSLFTPLILNVEYLFLRQCNSLGHKILLHQRSQINEYKMNIR